MKIDEKKTELISKIKTIYPSIYEEILNNIRTPVLKSFRVIDGNKEEEIYKQLLKEGFDLIKINGIHKAYSILNEKNYPISKSKAYINKEIYIQELSSMLAVEILEPKPFENILDLCAAPGSKTSQIANLTNNLANIFAVESNPNRIKRLKNVIEEYKVGANLIKTDGRPFLKYYPKFSDFFDRVLVDAPCTNEGSLYLNNTNLFKYWSKNEPKRISKLQKGLLNSGFKALKKNGILVYSTCTMSVEENELVIDWLLKKHKDAHLLNIDLQYVSNLEYVDGVCEYNQKNLNSNIHKTKRIIPNRYFSAFFIAKFTKI